MACSTATGSNPYNDKDFQTICSLFFTFEGTKWCQNALKDFPDLLLNC